VQWFYNGNPIAGATNDTLVVYNTGLYTAEGAPSVCPNYIMQLGLNLSVDSNQHPVVLPDSVPLCPGGVNTIATTVVTFDSFQWYIDGQAILNSNTSSFITFSSGYYHVVTDEDGCILSSDSVHVYDHIPLTPAITENTGTLYSVPGGSQLSNFQWFLNGSPISGANDSTFVPTGSGSYTVSAFDGTCIDTSAAYVFTVSVKEVNSNISFKLYPNPAQSDIYITSAEAVSVTLLDDLGRVVYNATVADTKHHLTLGHLATGVYYIKLTSEKGAAYEKVVLE
jgi:hypothetical protein